MEPVARPIATLSTRLNGALLLATCSAVLGAAIYLKPDPRGHGTHEQLGLAPCSMVATLGMPCPTCGMTTAFSLTMRGRFLAAAYVQPAGFVLALATIGAAAVGFRAAILGRWPIIPFWNWSPYRVFLGLLILMVGGWMWKVALAYCQRG